MSIGAGIDLIRFLRQAIVDKREARRWFIRWSVKEAMEHARGAPWPEVQTRAATLREWVERRLAARKDDEQVEENPLVDPAVLRQQHVCFWVSVALDMGAGLEFADTLLTYADEEFEAAGPFGDAAAGGFGSEKGT